MVDFLAADPQTEIIALHIEAVRHPRSFFSALKNAAKSKPVIVLKAGRGAGAGDEAVFDAAVERTGAIRCDRLEEFVTTLEVFRTGKNPPQGRLAMLCTGLGFALLTADAADRRGVVPAEFSPETEKVLSKICGACAGVNNPLAVSADADPELFAQALRACLADDNVDGIVVTLAPTAANATPRTAHLLAAAAQDSF